MNTALFILKRLIASKKYKNNISAPINKIGIISIALGMIVMLIAVATGIGLQKEIREKIIAFNGDILITNFDSNQSEISVNPITLNSTIDRILAQDKRIKHTQPIIKKAGLIKTASDFEGVIVKGIDKHFNWSGFDSYLIEGKKPDYSKEKSDDILISKTIAQRLQLKVGDTCNVWFVREDLNKPPLVRRWAVKGIFYTGFPDIDNALVLSDLRQLQKINKWQTNQVGGLEVFIDEFKNIDYQGKELYRLLPSEYNVRTVKESYPYIFEWIALFDSNIFVIISIMIIIAGFNMITALLVLILEQVRLIGVLKALGSNNGQIRKLFLYQATYLILKGLFWGNTIGISLLLLQKYFGFVKLNPENYYVDRAPVYLNIEYIVLLNLGVIFLTYFILILPSYIITKISPVRAIKFD